MIWALILSVDVLDEWVGCLTLGRVEGELEPKPFIRRPMDIHNDFLSIFLKH